MYDYINNSLDIVVVETIVIHKVSKYTRVLLRAYELDDKYFLTVTTFDCMSSNGEDYCEIRKHYKKSITREEFRKIVETIHRNTLLKCNI